MKIGIIIGSHREKSNSSKVGRYCARALETLIPGVKTWTYDLAGNPLPFWDESIWSGNPEWKKRWDPISTELKSCDGFVVVSPEWSGMVPAGLKNFFLLTDKTEIGHKPGFIIGVSSGRGGSYPVVELRMSSYKNTRLNWIPDHVIVRDADKVLNTPDAADESDRITRSNIDYGLKLLGEYSKALRMVRESGVIDHKAHPNGM